MPVDLAHVRNVQYNMGRSKVLVALWAVCSLVFLENPFLFRASGLRAAVLRAFGAKVGKGVQIRARVRVHFPWKLQIGDGCWIGEGAWLHNQDRLVIGSNVTVSQEAFITTGSHRLASMTLATRPVTVKDGAWITSRAIVLAGVTVGEGAVLSAGGVATEDLDPWWVYGGNPAQKMHPRLRDGS